MKTFGTLVEKAAYFGVEIYDVRVRNFQPLMDVITPRLVWRLRAVPVYNPYPKSATFVVDDPTDIDAIDTLMHLLKLEQIVVKLASEEDLDWAMRTHFASGEAQGKLEREEIRLGRQSAGDSPND